MKSLLMAVKQNGILRRLALGVLALGFAVVCGAQTAGADAAFDKKWQKLIKAAQKEGEVVVNSPGGKVRPKVRAAKPFQKKFGIRVVIRKGRGELVQQIRAEYAAGKHLSDVWVGGHRQNASALGRDGIIQSLEPLLIHPETDRSKFFGKKYWWADKQRKYAMLFIATPTTLMSYNTKIVDAGKFNSFWDLLRPEYKGKIAVNEPDPGSSANGVLIFMWANKELGPKYVRRLIEYADAGNGIFGECRQVINKMALGIYPLSQFCYSDVLRAKAKQGLPVDNRSSAQPFKEGSIITAGGGGALSVLANPPHPNAAKLYINWWLTREGQTHFQQATVDGGKYYTSARTDIPTDMIIPQRRRGPEVSADKAFFTMANPNATKWGQEVNKFWFKVRAELRAEKK